LKWPNDIIAGDCKLGGLLIDVQGETDGPVSVIVGIGINIDAIETFADQVVADGSLAPVGLRSLVEGAAVSRNRVAARLIDALALSLQAFQASGFAGFAAEWRRVDVMAGRPVTVQLGNEMHRGTASGIADDGALLLQEDGKVRAYVAGEVTLRAQADGSMV
jgi:BirA family biotin operon repressor/biotin-[acetyl-CoA-carboxylase] ligase